MRKYAVAATIVVALAALGAATADYATQDEVSTLRKRVKRLEAQMHDAQDAIARLKQNLGARETSGNPTPTTLSQSSSEEAPEISLLKVRHRNRGSRVGPDRTQERYHEVTMLLRNNSKKPILSWDVQLRDEQGRTYSNVVLFDLQAPTATKLQPGVKTLHSAFFEVPDSADPAAVGISSSLFSGYRWHDLP